MLTLIKLVFLIGVCIMFPPVGVIIVALVLFNWMCGD